MADRTCSALGCKKPARSSKAALCPMHYHRMYRHGSLDRTATGSHITVSHGRRYKTVTMASHPLAGQNGKVYEHRMVLYDSIGEGPHPCHWCAASIDWFPRGHPHALQVDHLNGYGDDNHLSNLVPACNSCNAGRGSQARSDALRAAGWWSNTDTIAALTSGGRRRRIA